MKNTFTKIVAALAIFMAVGMQTASAQSDNHTVTVDVQEINVLAITGNVTLTISSATAGSDPDDATDSSSTYDFTTNSNTAKKITAALDAAPPSGVTLKVATSPAGGTSAGTVTLSDSAAEVVSGLSKTKSTGVALNYTASATAAAGVTNTVFTVTYTLTN